MVSLKRMALKGRPLQSRTVARRPSIMLRGKPYVGLPVFRITSVAGEGKVKIEHQNLVLPFWGNIKEDFENKESIQGVSGPPDCILAVSNDGVPESEVVSKDPEPMGEGEVIWVKYVQTVFRLKYWVKTIWEG